MNIGRYILSKIEEKVEELVTKPINELGYRVYDVIFNASSCTSFSILTSSNIFAILNSGSPCCFVPKNSPEPLSSKSFSAILNPYQLRGRVGRGKFKSYCILKYNSNSAIVRERMKTMTTTEDGFKIAEKDFLVLDHSFLFLMQVLVPVLVF